MIEKDKFDHNETFNRIVILFERANLLGQYAHLYVDNYLANTNM